MAVQERHFTTGEDATRALASDITALLRAGIDAHGKASLAVSGGKSPVPLFEALRKTDLDWSKIWITLVDERWIDPASSDSNEHLLCEHLLRDGVAKAHFVPLKSDAATVREGLTKSIEALAEMPKPFDALVLGIGEDGHTASLFPGMPGLADALNPLGEARLIEGTAPVKPFSRISMTLAALIDSRCLFLTIEGARKHEAYDKARADLNGRQYPIAAVFAQNATPVSVLLVDD